MVRRGRPSGPEDGGGRESTHLSDGTHVSTVFLGIDKTLRFADEPDHKPVSFETRVFDGPPVWQGYSCSEQTVEEARAGHFAACERMRLHLGPLDPLPMPPGAIVFPSDDAPPVSPPPTP